MLHFILKYSSVSVRQFVVDFLDSGAYGYSRHVGKIINSNKNVFSLLELL